MKSVPHPTTARTNAHRKAATKIPAPPDSKVTRKRPRLAAVPPPSAPTTRKRAAKRPTTIKSWDKCTPTERMRTLFAFLNREAATYIELPSDEREDAESLAALIVGYTTSVFGEGDKTMLFKLLKAIAPFSRQPQRAAIAHQKKQVAS